MISDKDKTGLEDAILCSTFLLRNMKAIRLTRGMTQQQLANKSGMNRRQISFYETGWKVPRLEGMLRIAEALGVGKMQLKFMDITGKKEQIEVLCAVEIPMADRPSYIYRKTKDGYLVSKRRV